MGTQPSHQSLIAALEAPLREAASVDLADPAAARSALRRAWAPEGPAGQALRAALVEALEAGTICDRGPPECRYSRLVKAEAPAGAGASARPSAATRGWSRPRRPRARAARPATASRWTSCA